MLKRKIDKKIREHYAASNRALLITGARQIGKTYSIRQFGKSYKSFVEINFVEQPEAVETIRAAKNSADILLRLSALTTQRLIPGHTLIFFDEVQLCPEIVTAIKFLVDEGSYHYILSGSLLGVALRDLRSQPVGYLGVLDMYPLDLEEFIGNLGISPRVVESLRHAWDTRSPVDAFVHNKMLEIFRLYLLVGGMPTAVVAYLRGNNLQHVLSAQKDILRLYKRDIAQYAPTKKLLIEHIFELIPSELNHPNKRFILKKLNEKARFSSTENSFLWLQRAGVAIPVYNADSPQVPLILSRSRNLFKLFQSDVGLLAAQYADDIQLQILNNAADINFGAVYENAVAQELLAHGFSLYYFNSKKQGELDFLIEYRGDVMPIEVKSGKSYASHRALSNVMKSAEYGLKQAIVFSHENLSVQDRIIYAPIYMVMFLQKSVTLPAHYSIDLSGLTEEKEL